MRIQTCVQTNQEYFTSNSGGWLLPHGTTTAQLSNQSRTLWPSHPKAKIVQGWDIAEKPFRNTRALFSIYQKEYRDIANCKGQGSAVNIENESSLTGKRSIEQFGWRCPTKQWQAHGKTTKCHKFMQLWNANQVSLQGQTSHERVFQRHIVKKCSSCFYFLDIYTIVVYMWRAGSLTYCRAPAALMRFFVSTVSLTFFGLALGVLFLYLVDWCINDQKLHRMTNKFNRL